MRIIPLDLHLPITDINHLFYIAETTKDFTEKWFEVAGEKYKITKIDDDDYKLEDMLTLKREAMGKLENKMDSFWTPEK